MHTCLVKQATRTDDLCAAAMEEITKRVGTLTTTEDAEKAAAATRIQAHFRGHVVRKAFKLYQIGGAISEVLYSPAAYGVDLSSSNAPKPRARINSSACVVKNTLWLFGGSVEIGDKEVSTCAAYALVALEHKLKQSSSVDLLVALLKQGWL
jgi:hypothetical protein